MAKEAMASVQYVKTSLTAKEAMASIQCVESFSGSMLYST